MIVWGGSDVDWTPPTWAVLLVIVVVVASGIWAVDHPSTNYARPHAAERIPDR